MRRTLEERIIEDLNKLLEKFNPKLYMLIEAGIWMEDFLEEINNAHRISSKGQAAKKNLFLV